MSIYVYLIWLLGQIGERMFSLYMFFIENPHMVDYMYKLRMLNAYAECNSFTRIIITKCLTCWCIHIGFIKGVVTIMLLHSQNSQETFGSLLFTRDLRVKFSYGAGQTTTQWYIWFPGRYIVCLVTTYKKRIQWHMHMIIWDSYFIIYCILVFD